VGDVEIDVARAGQLQAGPQDARPARAIDVVIAVDDDLFLGPDRLHDPLGGLDRAGQEGRVVEAVATCAEEEASAVGAAHAPIQEEVGDQGRQAGLAAQGLDPVAVVRL
jgi:hypothetical protein